MPGVRSPTYAAGGLSTTEIEGVRTQSRRWADRATRTWPVDQVQIACAIAALYNALGLAVPRLAFVPSPGAMAFAGAFASRVWERRETDPDDCAPSSDIDLSSLGPHRAIAEATLGATLRAISGGGTVRRNPAPHSLAGEHGLRGSAQATVAELIRRASYAQAELATTRALDHGTEDAIRNAIDAGAIGSLAKLVREAMHGPSEDASPTTLMADAGRDWGHAVAAGLFSDSTAVAASVADAACWWQCAHSGNLAAAEECYITAARDVMGLRLPEHDAYASWEAAAVQGSFRYLHPEFCLMCDFPAEVTRNDEGLVTSCRWRDGWTLEACPSSSRAGSSRH